MTPARPIAVRYEGASLRYGDTHALRSVDLEISAGERVALVGPSGAGKSSLIGLANTSVAPTEGVVQVLGHRPAELSGSARRALRSRVGTVYQALHLPGPLRVVHNVSAGRLGAWSTGKALRSLVRPVDVDVVTDALESLGIADKMWSRTDELSGGERQRVALARLLVQRPDLILADEPISSLDPARGREVLEMLCTTASGLHDRTLVVSLHAFDLAVEYFDRVVGIRQGRIVFDAPASSLTADRRSDVAKELYDLTASPSP